MDNPAADEGGHDELRAVERVGAPLEGLDLYARLSQGAGGPFHDGDRIDQALGGLRTALGQVVARESTLHGWRTQTLFEAVVASLGKVRFLKTEDSGDIYFRGAALRPPDFRVVTEDGVQLLIEVKNFFQGSDPTKAYRLRNNDLAELRRYAELVGVSELRIAIYWVQWNLWTLTDVSRLEAVSDAHVGILLPDAMKANEMGALGDAMPGTEWPLAVTLFSDPDQSRSADETGVDFTIGKVEYSVAGKVVSRPEEVRIVHYLMLHGGWEEDMTVDTAEDQPVSVTFSYRPIEPRDAQGFGLHNPLSSIYSALFQTMTMTNAGEISDLRVAINPGSLRRLIPDDYKGDVLSVWRMRLRPA